MNVVTVGPLPAAALTRAEAMRVLVLLRPTMATFAPSAASASAAASPMPLVAPVIRICLSFTAQQSRLIVRASKRVDQIVLDLRCRLQGGAPARDRAPRGRGPVPTTAAQTPAPDGGHRQCEPVVGHGCRGNQRSLSGTLRAGVTPRAFP